MSANGIKILTLDALDLEPDPEWLVDQIFQRDTLAAICGNRNSFKTFMILDMGLSIAAGVTWAGRWTRRGNVLHIVGEGGRGIKKRKDAWLVAHSLDNDDLGERWRCTVKAVDMMTQADELIDTIRAAYPHAHLDMLVIDTFARNCSGDENSTQQMKYFVAELDRVVQAFPGLCLVLIHHNSKAGGFRGNTAVDGALNTLFLLDRQNDQVVVHCDKQKDAEEVDDFVLTQRLVQLEDGSTGMVLVADEHADPEGEKMLELIDKMGSGAEGATREQVLAESKKQKVFGDRKFNDVWKRLKEAQVIVTADGRPEAKRGTRWIRNLQFLDLTL